MLVNLSVVSIFSVWTAAEAIRTKNHMLLKGKAVRVMWSTRVAAYRKSGSGNVFVKVQHAL